MRGSSETYSFLFVAIAEKHQIDDEVIDGN